MVKRRAMVVGGSGYVGQHLVPALRAAGWSVVATANKNSRNVPREPGVRVRLLDVSDPASVSRVLEREKPSVIINCSAAREADQLGPVVVDGTRYLARASAAMGAVFVLLSTDNVFDGVRGWYGEDDPVCPVNAYGRAKAAAEEITLRLTPSSIIVRTSLVCGLEPLDPRSRWIVSALERGEVLRLFTDELRCPVWVDELVSGVVEMIEGGLGGIMHLAGPERLSRYDIGVALGQHFGLAVDALIPSLASRYRSPRTLDGSLAIGRARNVLETRLTGFRERLAPSPD